MSATEHPETRPEDVRQRLQRAWAAAKQAPSRSVEEVLALQTKWEREDATGAAAGMAKQDVRYLAALGFPSEDRRPTWRRLPRGFGAPLQEYCHNLTERIGRAGGLYLGSTVGRGKTSAFALVTLRARQLGLSCIYVLAGGW